MESLSKSETDDLLKSLLLLSQSVHRVLESRVVEMSVEGLSHSKISLLRILARGGAQSPTELAEFLNVSRPAVSQITAEMLEHRLIVKSRSTEDSRRLVLEITAEGLAVVHRIEEAQRHLIRVATDYASEGTAQRWLESVRELGEAIVQADDRYGEHCYQCNAFSDGACVLVGGGAECSYRTSLKARG